MDDAFDLRYAGPAALSTAAADPDAVRISLYCRSRIPAGMEICVTAGDYRAHAEGVLSDRWAGREGFSIEEVSTSAGDTFEFVEAEPAVTFAERAKRRMGGHYRLVTVRLTEPVDRSGSVTFTLHVSAGAHAGNDLALDARARHSKSGAGSWRRVGGPIVLPARAGPPARIEVRPRVDGSQLCATVFATDSLLNPTAGPDRVRLEATTGSVAGLPETVPLADGPVTVEGEVRDAPVRVSATGPHGQRCESRLLTNPGQGVGAGDRPLYGAIHFHTRFSGDGGRAMADAYRYARDVLGLDFAAATDHTPADDWESIVEINERFDDPGSFATLPAWEWSTDEGHANLYLRSPDADATPDRECDADFPYEVEWPADAIMAPHHTNQRSDELTDEGDHYWREYDWSIGNDRMGFVEVHQTRGNFEADAVDPDWRIKEGGIGASVQDALARGYRLGFVGGTDNHTGYPTRGAIGSYDDVVGRYVGLTGVYAAERTRAAIWDALEARRTFATTGVPIRVGFAVNGEPLGGVAPVDGGDGPDPTFDAALHGTAPIERVEVIADAGTVWSADPGERDVRLEGEVLPDPGDPGYYYLRLRQADDHMAWASPVWIAG